MKPGLIAPGGLLLPGAPRPPHHPYADLFPMLAEERRASFRASLQQGQNRPIVLHKGAILDGRNRERELVELAAPVAYVVFTGTNREALDYVIAENLERRDLTDKQRAMIAAKIATLRLGDNQHTRRDVNAPTLPLSEQPNEIAAPDRSVAMGAADADSSAPQPPASAAASQDQESVIRNQGSENVERAPIGGGSPDLSLGEAATLMNVPRRSAERAAVIERQGVPELKEAVESGPLSLAAGETIAKLSEDEQKKIVAAADPKVVKEIAKKNRAEKQTKSRDKRLANMAKAGSLDLIDGKKYGVHLIDIPREFVAWSDATGAEKSPHNHYRVEGFDYLAGLHDKILACSAENCVVVMWAWANSLIDQIELLAEWGFASLRPRDGFGRLVQPSGKTLPPVGEGRYRSHQVWAKRNADGSLHRGMGFWFIDGHELLLVGARGDVPAPLPGTQAASLLDLPIGAHSEKPGAAIRDQIDRYFPGVQKLEWFARVPDLAAFKQRHPDWDVTGNEVFPGAAEPVREAAE